MRYTSCFAACCKKITTKKLRKKPRKIAGVDAAGLPGALHFYISILANHGRAV